MRLLNYIRNKQWVLSDLVDPILSGNLVFMQFDINNEKNVGLNAFCSFLVSSNMSLENWNYRFKACSVFENLLLWIPRCNSLVNTDTRMS
jgi:hypothetical protein